MKKFKFPKEINLVSLFLIFSICIYEPISSSSTLKGKKLLNTEYLKQKPSYEYILGEGDSLYISITPLAKDLDDFYFIDVDGSIFLPILNRVYVKGLTTIELTNLLNKKYKEFVKKPELEIRLTDYRPVRFYIEGEIEVPGLYYLEGSSLRKNFLDNPSQNNFFPNTNDDEIQISSPNSKNPNFLPLRSNYKISNNFFPTLHDAIREAGGISNFSDLSNIEVIRQNSLSNGGGQIKANISLLSLINGNDQSQNIRLYDGDIIKIKKSKYQSLQQISKAIKSNLNPRIIEVYISGRVEQPGKRSITKGSSLNDAIDLAGGPKVMKGKVIFTRFNLDGSIDKRKFAYKKNASSGTFKNPYLKTGDIIRIGKSPVNVANEVLTEITSPFIGIYSTVKVLESF